VGDQWRIPTVVRLFLRIFLVGGVFDVNLGESEDGMEGTEKSMYIGALDKYLFPFFLLRGLS